MKHLLAITCVGVAVLCPLPAAMAAVVKYDQTHTFTLLPGGNVAPEVAAHTFQHAWVHDPNLRSDVKPGQLPNFNPGGREFVGSNGQVGQLGLALPVSELNTNIPPSGLNIPKSTAKVTPPPGTNSAEANSEVTVNPFVTTNVVKGKMRVFGEADATGPKDAYAFSSARVTARGRNVGSTGRIDWRDEVRTQTLAGGLWQVWDPIYFETFDINTGGLLDSGTLLKIFAQGDGDLDWSSNTLSFDVLDAEFGIDIASPFTAEHGTLSLVVSGGLVTSALATGMFSSLVLPALGHAGAFTMALGNDFALNYDLDHGQNRNLDVNFDFSGGGSAFAPAPEPGTMALVALGLMAALASSRQRHQPKRGIAAAAAAPAQ